MSNQSPGPSRYTQKLARNNAPKVCLHCQSPFTSTRYWQRFCTKSCHDTYHKIRYQLARQLLEDHEDHIRPATLDELAE
jgi:hypothetical protein